jgi:hypothetical protein
MAALLTHISTYADALAYLKGRRSAPAGNNTTLLAHPYLSNSDGTPRAIFVKLHGTNVVTYLSDGRIVLDTGGWRTVTTKDRLNRFTPADVRVYADLGDWYVRTREGVRPFDAYGHTIRPERQAAA